MRKILSKSHQGLASLGAKYFFEDLLHRLVRKLLLHLKGAMSHLQLETQCLSC